MKPTYRALLILVVSLFASWPGRAQTSLLPAENGVNRPWMHPNVAPAWSRGYLGQGTAVTVVDDFTQTRINGDLRGYSQTMTHGGWTATQARLIAPQTFVAGHSLANNTSVPLVSGRLNIFNASYGMPARSIYEMVTGDVGSDRVREKSLINYAAQASAIVVKAFGNDGTSFVASDVLATALRTTRTTIFVGALETNGSPAAPTRLAWYSNRPGPDLEYQLRFLTVGVNSAAMGGLAGTSFAAPIISGYAALLGSKFPGATPQAVVNRLLVSARTDTIQGYTPAVYGRGEASIYRALAPNSIQ